MASVEFVGWCRVRRRGERWQKLCTAATAEAAWRQLNALAGDGRERQLVVLPAGVNPKTVAPKRGSRDLPPPPTSGPSFRRARHGRPSKFTEPARAAILQSVRNGNTRRDAALAAGIEPRTFRRWLAKGRKQRRGAFCQFLSALKRAEAKAVVERVQVITAAGESGTWQAAAWWLERRYPKEWAVDRHKIKDLLRDLTELLKGGSGGNRRSDALATPMDHGHGA
jgi:hypothetical protein